MGGRLAKFVATAPAGYGETPPSNACASFIETTANTAQPMALATGFFNMLSPQPARRSCRAASL
jgi:hypothetical protein